MSSPEVLAAMIAGFSRCWPLRSGPMRVPHGPGELRRPAVDSGFACPHVEIKLIPDGGLAVRALPISQLGSLQQICGSCGGVFHESDVARIHDDWTTAFKADSQKASDAYWEEWNTAGKAP